MEDMSMSIPLDMAHFEFYMETVQLIDNDTLLALHFQALLRFLTYVALVPIAT